MTRRQRRWLFSCCLAILLAAAIVVPLPMFVEQPGDLLSLPEHVDLALDSAETEALGEIDGDFLLTVVNLRRATVYWLVRGAVDDDTVFLNAQRLTGGQDDATYFDHQRTVFSSTAETAAAVGLRAAGYEITVAEPRGALVASVLPGAPAEGSLQAGDVVTAVEGAEVRSAAELVAAVRRAGESTLEITFVRDDREGRVRVTPRRLGDGGRPLLGLQPEDLTPPIDLPVPVDVDSGRIGGPSAGLMIALTVYDKASPDDLAAGRRVAGTGGITVDGAVTPVGGVDLKVRSAEREGADVFLAPADQVDVAMAARSPGSGLEVVGVATFDEALAALAGG